MRPLREKDADERERGEAAGHSDEHVRACLLAEPLLIKRALLTLPHTTRLHGVGSGVVDGVDAGPNQNPAEIAVRPRSVMNTAGPKGFVEGCSTTVVGPPIVVAFPFVTAN